MQQGTYNLQSCVMHDSGVMTVHAKHNQLALCLLTYTAQHYMAMYLSHMIA